MITLFSRVALPVSKKRLLQAVRIVLQQLKASARSISIVFCNDRCIQRFNRLFLHRNSTTDVIAFFDDKKFPGYDPSYLGDIVISVERARAQAKELRHSVAEELMVLVIHGILHLVGYDDTSPGKKKTMFRRQEQLFKKYIASVMRINSPHPSLKKR